MNLANSVVYFRTPLCASSYILNNLNSIEAKKIIVIEFNRKMNPQKYKNAIQYYKNFTQYFSFTFVRNPFDRIISVYKKLSKSSRGRDLIDAEKFTNSKSFTDFVESLTPDTIRQSMHLTPITTNLFQDKFHYLDFIGKIEDFPKESGRLLKESGNLKLNLRYVKGRDYRSFYNKKTKFIVEELYKKDLETFNYEF